MTYNNITYMRADKLVHHKQRPVQVRDSAGVFQLSDAKPGAQFQFWARGCGVTGLLVRIYLKPYLSGLYRENCVCDLNERSFQQLCESDCKYGAQV